jgi:ProP effector
MTANDLPTPDSAAVPVNPAPPDSATPPAIPAEAPAATAAEPATPPTAAAAESEQQPAGGAATMSPAACAEKLKSLFPALFTGPAKPIKLRIQADIQARAPGVFTKAALSGFLRRYTGGTGYLIALTRAPHRIDLDGQPAGEISAEHRQAAADELARRRQVHEGRRQAEEDQRRERAQLLRTFETTTLTKDNFCALKGITPEALDALLAQARQEAEEFARQRPPHAQPGGRPDHRGPRPDRRPHGPGQERSGPRGEHRGDQRRAGAGSPGGAPRGETRNGHPDSRRDGAPRGERGPRPPRPNR